MKEKRGNGNDENGKKFITSAVRDEVLRRLWKNGKETSDSKLSMACMLQAIEKVKAYDRAILSELDTLRRVTEILMLRQ